MKKLSRIIVCFILVIALVLTTAACKPAKPTPEVTTTPTPVVTATPTPEKTPTPVTPTPAPTKKPGGSLTFPDGWDKPLGAKKIDAAEISALSGNGSYEVNAINAAVATEIKNDKFSGKLTFNAINVGTSALTINTPKATVEMKGAVKCGAFNVTTSENTFIVNGIVIEADNIVINGGNILLMEGTKVVGTIKIPDSNGTTTKIEITGAETQSITILDSTNPIDVTVKGASDVSIDNQSTKPTKIAVEGSSKTAITNAQGSTLGVTVKGDSKTTVDNAGTSTVNVDGNSQVAVDNKATGTVAVEVGASASPTIKMDNANTAADSSSVKVPATSTPIVDLGNGTNAPTIKDETDKPVVTKTFDEYVALDINKDIPIVSSATSEIVVVLNGQRYKGKLTENLAAKRFNTITAAVTNLEKKAPFTIFPGSYTDLFGATILITKKMEAKATANQFNVAGINVLQNNIFANGKEVTIEAIANEPKGAKFVMDGITVLGTYTENSCFYAWNVYGGGNENTVEKAKITMNGGAVGRIYGGGFANYAVEYRSLVNNAEIIVNGGKAYDIIGGGLGYSTVNNANITINNGTISANVQGGGMASVSGGVQIPASDVLTGNVTKNVVINISGANTSMTNVFAGGQGYACVENCVINIENGTFVEVIGTGSNGYTKKSVINFNGGTVTGYMHSINNGTPTGTPVLNAGDDFTLNVTGGTIAALYLGNNGESGQTTGKVTYNLGSGATVTKAEIGGGLNGSFELQGIASINMAKNFELKSGKTIVVGKDATLTVASGVVFTNNGTLTMTVDDDASLRTAVSIAKAGDTIVSELAKTPQEIVDLVKNIAGIKDKNIVIKNTNKGELYYLAFALQGLYQDLCSEGRTNVWLATVTTYGGELVAINNKATISYSYDGVNFEKMPFVHEVITGGNVPLGSENQNSAWTVDATKPFVWFKVDSIAENTIEIAWQHSNGTYNVQDEKNGEAVKVNVEFLKGVYGDKGIWFIVDNPSKPRECTYKVSKPNNTALTPDTFAQNFIGEYKVADGSDVIRFAENGGVVKSLLPGEVKAGKDDSATTEDESKTPVPAWGSVAGAEYVNYIVGVDGAIVSNSAKLGGYWGNAYFKWNEDYTQITLTKDCSYKISLVAEPTTKTLTAGTVFTKVISTVTTSEELETAVAAGGTVILGNDITLLKQITIAEDVAVVLDSNAKKVTYDGVGARPIINRGNLTVIGKGRFEVTNAGSFGVIDNFGQLTITDCTFTSEDAAGDGAMLKNRPAGVMTLNNVTAISKSKADKGNACVTSEGKLTINGGSYSNNSGLTNQVGMYSIVIKTGESELNNPTVYGAKGALGLSGGNNTINGGKYSATNYSAIYIAGGYATCTATINDGDFESVGLTCVRIGNSTPGDGGACLKASAFIKGGKFNAKGTETKIINVDLELGNPSITGGKFSQDIDDGIFKDKKFVAEGYECVKDGNTEWYIVRKKA